MPSSKQVHVDAALSSFIAGYEPAEYFADIISPIVETQKASDKYTTYLREDVERRVDDALAENGQASELDYSQGTGSYLVKDRGLKGVVTRKTQANADEPQDPREFTTQQVMWALMREREIRVADGFNSTSNYATSNTSAAANPWTNTTSGTPLADVDAMKEALAPGMMEKTELVMVLAKPTWHALRRHPDLRGAGAESRVVTLQEAANLLEVDRILVSEAWKLTNNRGQAATRERIWSPSNAIIARVPSGEPSGLTGLFAATMRFAAGAGFPIEVRTWDDPSRGRGGSEVVQVEFSDDEIFVQNDMAYLLTGVA
ncbi:MAG: hypothetical protein AAGE52_01205 [Myxococcota bacterium]